MNNFKISKNTDIKWNKKELGEVCLAIKDGTHGSFENNFNKTSRYLLSAKNIKSGNLIIGKNERRISEGDYSTIVKNGFPQKGDLLLTTVGTIGEKMIWEKDFSESFQRSVSFIRVNDSICNKFLYHCFSTNYLKDEIKNKTKVGAQPGIYLGDLKSLSLLIPPLSQQSFIASILSAQESIINDMETLVEKYETRLRYLSEELLSGRLRIKEVEGKTVFYKNTEWKEVEINGEIKEIPVDWEVDKISDIFEVQRGSVLSKDYIKNNLGIYPVYSSATENNGSIGNIKTYMFDGEFLTWTTDGVYAGTVFYRNGKFNCTNICGLLKIKNNQKSIKGISYFVKQELIKHVNHIGNSKLMSNTVSNVELVYASQKELFLLSGFMSKKEDLVETQKKLLEKEKEKFNFLLNNLLFGNYLVEKIAN